MKVTDTYDIQRSGISGEKGMTIRASAKAFELLTAKLYSDRPGSVVRELAANAFDSHIKAGKRNIPFEIMVPTAIDPHLVVRDYGTGLPPEELERLFGTVFESTKDTSNDFIGAFGLGSKSPFSLTDSYTVEGRWNNKKHMYLVFKNEQKIPSILCTGVMDTDEPNGITVKVPVNTDQYTDFAVSIRNQLHLFDPKPVVTNYKDFSWLDTKYNEVLLNTVIFQLKGAHSFPHKHCISMGNIIYPLETIWLELDIKNRFTRIQYNTISKFEIGELEILPSREGLTYDEKTVKKLTSYFTEWFNEYDKHFIGQIQAASNIYEANKKLQEFRESDYYWVNYPWPILYDGKDIRNSRDLTVSYEYATVEIIRKAIDISDLTGKTTKDISGQYPGFQITWVTGWEGRRNYGSEIPLKSLNFNNLNEIESGTKLVLVDNPVNIRRKVGILHDNHKKVLLVKRVPGSDGNTLDWNCFLNPIKTYIPDIQDKAILLSSVVVPKPTKKANAGKIEGVTEASATYPNGRSIFDIEDIQEDSPYICYKRNDAIGYTQNPNLGLFVRLTDAVVYKVQKTGESKIKKLLDRGLLPLDKWVASKLEGHVLDEYLAERLAFKEINPSGNERSNIRTINSECTGKHEFIEFIARQSVIDDKKETYSDANAIIKWIFECSLNEMAEYKDLPAVVEYKKFIDTKVELQENFYNELPLIRYIIGRDWGYGYDPKQITEDVVNYIKDKL